MILQSQTRWCLVQLAHRMAMGVGHDVAFLDYCLGFSCAVTLLGVLFMCALFLTINFPYVV